MTNIKKLERMGYFSADEIDRLERGRVLWYSEIVDTSREFIKDLGWDQDKLFYRMIPSCEYVITVYYDGVFICSIPPLKTIKEMRQFEKHFSMLKDQYYKAYENGICSDIIDCNWLSWK